jgi:hypothetical protein
MLVTVTVAARARSTAPVIAAHLHAGLGTWTWVTTISTVRPTMRECRSCQSAGRDKCGSAEDGR